MKNKILVIVKGGIVSVVTDENSVLDIVILDHDMPDRIVADIDDTPVSAWLERYEAVKSNDVINHFFRQV